MNHETINRMPPRARVVDDPGLISVIALVSATVGGGVGVMLARGIGRPMAAVARGAAQVSADDRSARLDGGSAAGEVAALLDSFNRMAAENALHERERAVLTAGIAHELRTPLTVLKGRLHGLTDGVIDPVTGEADRLLRQVSHLSRLVEDLLALSHANAGALALDRRGIQIEDAKNQGWRLT